MSDPRVRIRLRAYHVSHRVQVGTKTHGGPNEYADYCPVCDQPYPCFVINALDDAEAVISSLLEQLAAEQGLHQACEEIIARTRALALSYERPLVTWNGMPMREAAVPVSEIYKALGPEPTP
jgi:hypothetical protein